ncbi:SDR family NAD(P)-dependent oxidoreductase [Mucilaginibacter sabulilitoris]|uniref:SDR family NAD(P)-dependent oxidoreductase n=1 Tax=Mucilaginibacter sabulilitoris TaxID=1173583 RepID=A0ABZ0TRI6_9SPHI|nr:SDR family NAD(P)-dependent oxidoreductase [Mucilaginibacter sabulilitoris]WPU94763.1 SDR family NAD(P)-dependent oxidoreductase [Mucilaginibacter sabulilitoris]
MKNKKALVTGGSKWIGKAIVRELAELGAEVLFTSCNARELVDARSEMGN